MTQMTTSVPYRQLKVEDALAYLDLVKAEYEMQPHVYNQFLDIMKEFKARSIDTPGVIDRMLNLFHGKRQLILGFNTFLPPGYKIEFTTDENQPRVQLKYPPGMTGPQPQPYIPPSQQPVPPLAPPPAALFAPAQPAAAPFDENQPAARSQRKAPIEFDHAINYVTKIKQRFSQEPATYRAFLEILHVFQKEQKSIKSVYEEVYRLFKDHPDLIAEFSQFLPDGSPPRPPPMVRWRRAVRLVGKLQMLHRRAAQRAYAPGGGGFLAARDEFEELAGSPTSAEPAVDLDVELPDEELPEAAEAAEAGEASASGAGESMESEDSDSGASIASTIKGLPRRKLQDILLSLAEDPAEQERIVRALQAAAERPTTKGRGGGKQKGKRRFHRAAAGAGVAAAQVRRTPSVEAY